MRLLLLSLVLACPAQEDTAEQVDPMEALLAPGEFQVGFHQEELSYSDPSLETERGISLRWWYPTEETNGVLPTYRSLVQPEAVWQDAPAASGSFPVLVSSHGSQGYAEGSSFLFEHFASHGWIVVAPDHTNNTLFDHVARTNDIYLQRPLDISAVLDHVENLPDPHLVQDRVGSPIIANGHSFGGYTLHALAGAAYDMEALQDRCIDNNSGFCDGYTPERETRFTQGLEDQRISAHISMAPGDFDAFGTSGLARVETPILLMTSELDEATGSDSDPIWEALVGEQHLRIDLLRGGHTTFTDYAGLFEDSEIGLEPEEGWSIIRGYALAFASIHAGNDSWSALLEDEVSISASAIVMRK